MAGTIDKRLAEKGIELPQAAVPVANYVPVTIAGKLAFVSGQVTVWNGEFKFKGKLGKDFTVEQGQQAARQVPHAVPEFHPRNVVQHRGRTVRVGPQVRREAQPERREQPPRRPAGSGIPGSLAEDSV